MSMMDQLESQTLDPTTRTEVTNRPVQALDPVVLDYLHDAALPSTPALLR